jgi:hypothetical protein
MNLFILSIQTAFASSASIYYSDGPWSGRIIDADTKVPIEGAVVVAVWYKVYSTPTGDSSYFFDAVEALTDKDGKFFLPKFKALNLLPIIRRIEGPNFIVYKPEYAVFPGFGAQHFDKYFPTSPLRVGNSRRAELFKKGVVIELPKVKRWIERIENHELSFFYGFKDAPDSKIQNFRRIIKEEENYLEKIKLKHGYDREKLNILIDDSLR